MMNTFIIVNITSIFTDSLEDKSVLAKFKKAFPLTSLGNFLKEKVPFFAVLIYSLYGHREYFKFKRKYQEIRLVFPDLLPVSYDNGARNLDEYFHFYSTAGQKFKMKEIFLKI